MQKREGERGLNRENLQGKERTVELREREGKPHQGRYGRTRGKERGMTLREGRKGGLV